MKTAIFLYELHQLASLDAMLAKWGDADEAPRIVSLDAEIDSALLKRNVPFISGKTLQNRTSPDAYVHAEELARDICAHEAFSSFTYRNIPVLESLRFSIHLHLLHLLYYVDIIARLLEHLPDLERIVVPVAIVPVSKTSDPLETEELKIVYEAACLVAASKGIRAERYDTLSVKHQMKSRSQGWLFTGKRALFGAALSSVSLLMSLRPRRPLRLLASDYWRNIEPVMRDVPEAELILIDRTEAFRAGFVALWRHKMQSWHIAHFLSAKGRRRALAHAAKYKHEWIERREGILASIDLSFRGVNLKPAVLRVMTLLIESAVPDIVCDIEGAYALYERLAPDAVLLRASVSRQRHFSILPLVARELGIPSLEIQHGGEYIGPGSGTRRHAAYYLATYGPLVCDEFQTLGYEKERLLAVGSPRFDAYVKNAQKTAGKEKGASTIILSNTPSVDVNERYGTYSIEEYFGALGAAITTLPNAHLLVATRSTSVRGAFQEESRARGLAGVKYESVGTTPLPELFQKADIFVCSYSTVVYEALIYRLPVILAAFAPVEKMMADFHFSRFEKAGALRIAHTPEELTEILQELAADPDARARMNKAGWDFIQKNFSFDGHAAERIATFIRSWVTKRVSN